VCSRVEAAARHVPRYFFNMHDGKDNSDRDGVELAGLAEARNQAMVAPGEMIRSHGHTIWDVASGEWM
jgi:hypothetical protein